MQNTEHNLWTRSKRNAKLSALVSSVLLLMSNAFAAKIPEGVALAEKQEVRIQITAEAATLDPQKMEGIREGLLARNYWKAW